MNRHCWRSFFSPAPFLPACLPVTAGDSVTIFYRLVLKMAEHKYTSTQAPGSLGSLPAYHELSSYGLSSHEKKISNILGHRLCHLHRYQQNTMPN